MAGVHGTVTQRVTAETVKEARALWDEGFTTTVIGQKMGRSKNSICSIAGRFNFPSRGDQTKRPVERVLDFSRGVKRQAVAKPLVAPEPAPRPRLALVPALKPMEPAAPPAVFKPRASPSCCWPMWGQERPTQRFCDGQSVPGKPYCVAHCRIAYRMPDAPAVPTGGPVVIHPAVWGGLRASANWRAAE